MIINGNEDFFAEEGLLIFSEVKEIKEDVLKIVSRIVIFQTGQNIHEI